MKTITNDKQFKATIDELSSLQNRKLATLFLQNVMGLTDKKKYQQLLTLASNKNATEQEYANLQTAIQTMVVETNARCGTDTDWAAQAEHFVAKSALSCVKDANRSNQNSAYDSAMYARMACNFASIADGKSDEQAETQAQYQILIQFLGDK
ncbi:MAG: hypothetical protein DRQ51_05750 [Gammaproteobacteria bacterium]|nr:MAG: hypothetical protein DRQ51_05750 [Gammaproteobacteria bacterium]